MPGLNTFFNNLGETGDNSNEQSLINDLMKESISIMGINIHYLPRDEVNVDELYGEDTLATYTTEYSMAAYVESVQGWDGNEKVLTEYGIAFQDQIDFRIAKLEYEEVMGADTRPLEGDIIFMPLSGNLFSIISVSSDGDGNQFYPNGTQPSFIVKCDEYVYSQESFNTGNPEIDNVNTNEFDPSVVSIDDGDNESIQVEADPIIADDESSPFGSF